MEEQKNERLKGWKYGLRKHLSDATSVSTFTTPIRALVDQLSGVTDLESIEARGKTIGLNYAGLVQLLRLRDYSKKKLGIARSTNKALHYLHDTAFTMAIGIPIQVGIYAWSGVEDWRTMAMTIGGGVGLICLLAGPFGQFVDIYRELLRIKKSKNTPAFVKRLKNSTKRKVAVGLTVASLAVTSVLYPLVPNINLFSKPSRNTIEQKVQSYENVLDNAQTKSIYSVPVEAEK